MAFTISAETGYYVVNAALFSILGAFTLHRSIARRVFNITWMGGVLATYAVYYLLIFLNNAGVIPGFLGFALEAVFFTIMLQLLVFTKTTFFKSRLCGRFITFTVLIMAIGFMSCALAASGDVMLPYNGIHDVYDVWRYFLDDFIVGPLIFLVLFFSCVRSYHNVDIGMAGVRRRLVLFGTTTMSIQALWVLNFFGALVINPATEAFTVLTGVLASLMIVTLYLGWLTKGESIQQSIDLPAIPRLDAPPGEGSTRVVTDLVVFKVMELLGDELATLIHKTPASCKGLLLLVIVKELGETSLSKLNLAKLPGVFDGGLRNSLQDLGVVDVDSVVASLEAFFVKNYGILSFGLY